VRHLVLFERRFRSNPSAHQGRGLRQAWIELLVRGTPAPRMTVELARLGDGRLEVYFSSEHSPVPTFVGYADQIGVADWEDQFWKAEYDQDERDRRARMEG